MVSDISEELDFWWSIPQKVTIIGHFGAKNDPTIRISNSFWWNEVVEVIEAIEVVEAVEVIEAAEVLRPGKSTTGDFRIIQVFEFSFILMFWKNIFWG